MIVNTLEQLLETKIYSKIAVFIRHGEKSEQRGLLSKNGIENTKIFAQKLKMMNLSVKLYSSPEERCIQTAEIITALVPTVEKEIAVSNKLGKPGIHIINSNLYDILYKKYSAREIYSQWKKGLNYEALKSPEILRIEAEDFIKETCDKTKINIFISQSGTIAGMGYSLGITNYDVQSGEWVDYLDGFVYGIN